MREFFPAEILDARPLLPGAPKLGRLVAAARYRIGAAGRPEPWPESEAGLADEIRAGVRCWQRLDDGDLLVELNARQEDGPQLSVKKLLLAIGVAEDRVARVPVTREMLVLEARSKHQDTSDETRETVVR